MRKIPMQLRGTNFCTGSARFAPSFVREPNGSKCTQKVRNSLEHEFRVQRGGSSAFVAKNSNATSSHKLLGNQMVQNSAKHEFRVKGVDRVRLLRKIAMRLRGTKFCTSSARLAPSFVRQPNGPKCTQMVQKSRKHELRVQWGGSGALVAKNSNATSSHKLLH